MKEEILFTFSFTKDDGEPLKLDFFEREDGVVTVALERYDGSPVFKNCEIVDLFGKKTHVPAKIKELLKLRTLSWAQLEKIQLFQQICVNRLDWSFGCLGAY